MTLREVVWAVDGWNAKEDEDRRERAELARLGWFFSMRPWAKGNLQPDDLLKFPWEEAKMVSIDKEQFKCFPDKWPLDDK